MILVNLAAEYSGKDMYNNPLVFHLDKQKSNKNTKKANVQNEVEIPLYSETSIIYTHREYHKKWFG